LGTYEIDIIIDGITPCLFDVKRNKYVDTTYEIVKRIDKRTAEVMQKYEKWKFDWSDSELLDCTIYALYVEGSTKTQGLIACRSKKNYVEVVLAESNPLNVGETGLYHGVGAHLFALACKKSFNEGNEGYVYFVSKTSLVEHYVKNLHAKVLFDRNLAIETEAATYLVNKYDEKARDKYGEEQYL
jgi:pimeloyl-CoA synthetase